MVLVSVDKGTGFIVLKAYNSFILKAVMRLQLVILRSGDSLLFYAAVTACRSTEL